MSAPRLFSALLDDIYQKVDGAALTLGMLNTALHERGLGLFLFLFALPAALPLPGLGINTIIALPLLLISGHIALGKERLWLPRALNQKTIKTANLQKAILHAKPFIQKIEHIIRPRLGFITQGAVSQFVGLCAFIMAIYVAIPLPLTNTVPSFGLALIGIGMVMRDGLLIIGGLLVGLFWIVLLTALILFLGAEAFDFLKQSISAILAA